MIVFDTFVPSSVLLEAKKEEQVVKDWIYRGEEDYTTSITTPISPMRYGKGYSLLQKMGYQGQGPLSNNGHSLIEPLSHMEDLLKILLDWVMVLKKLYLSALMVLLH